MKLLNDFKKFAIKGNAIELAIGIIIGTAFNKIISSLVNDIIMPALGIFLGGINFSTLSLKFIFFKEIISISYGKFLQNIIDFFIIALSLFLVLKFLNNFKGKEPPKSPSNEEKLLTEIRDLLKEKKERE
ncbi:large conductance mechanosensitive channel [Cetobacterium ceti]|uniref:Large-conductance mechanosensitive channel n=1 Tax=Cetobacterium ceti TaxID=180163 RepID=A0A1T4QZ25_9FUSO|nr:large-conductance mechanosensitive channel protein MscL [Cetobacterium ceti]SKA09029.1 large conductance mechanosensitive channel [Cetobacterium ceti]